MAADHARIAELLEDLDSATTHHARWVVLEALRAHAVPMARELLRLRNGAQYIRGTCDLAYFFSTLLDTPEHKAVGANLKEVRNLLDHLLEGDTE